MNAKIAVEMQNAFGRFIQLYHLNKSELAEDLFAENGELWIPDRDIKATGKAAVRETLKQLSEKRIADGKNFDVHMPHTPGFDTTENDTKGLASWDLHTYYITEDENHAQHIEYTYGRIDATFVNEDGKWKFLNLDWWDVESFTPWDYSTEKDDSSSTDVSSLPLPPAYTGLTSVRDFYACQNVMSRYGLNNRHYPFEDTFANRDDITFDSKPLVKDVAVGKEAVQKAIDYLNDLEAKNDGLYVYVPCTGAPVVEINEDGSEVNAQWLASVCTFEGKEFGYNQPPYKYVRRCGLITAKFVKENGQWRIKDFATNMLLTVPGIDFDSHCQLENTGNNLWYQRVGMPENKWKPAAPKMGGDFPEELPYLESVLATWVSHYRRGDYINFFEEYCFNEEYETFFHSRGRGRCAPAVIGTDNMKEFFGLGAFHYHHQQITNHGGMSPDIEIAADGRYATMTYFDINTTAFDPRKANSRTIDVSDDWSQENSEFEHTPCRHQLSVYNLACAKVDGVWKLIQIDWETIVAWPEIYLEGKASRGWAGSVTDVKYPALFEKYQYSPIRKVEKKK